MMRIVIAVLVFTTVVPALGQERAPGERPTVQPQPRVGQPQVQPEPRGATTGVRPAASSDFERMKRQATAARPPGGQPDAESDALRRKLEAQHASRVEAENAKIQAMANVAGALKPMPDPKDDPGPGDSPEGEVFVDESTLDVCSVPETPLQVESIQATPPLDPGEWVLVDGCGLGTTPGELRLLGDFPGGHLELDVQNWHHSQIVARLPLVTGVGDMPAAKLQIARNDGQLSEWIDVGGFRATREVKLIHPADVYVTCGGQYGSHECTLAQSHPLSESDFFGGASFAAQHRYDSGPIECEDAVQKIGGDHTELSDVAVVNLFNGWVIAGYYWWWDELAGETYVEQPTGVNLNASSSNVSVAWGLFTNSCEGVGPFKSQLRYRVDLYAVGPKGVPYK